MLDKSYNQQQTGNPTQFEKLTQMSFKWINQCESYSLSTQHFALPQQARINQKQPSYPKHHSCKLDNTHHTHACIPCTNTNVYTESTPRISLQPDKLRTIYHLGSAITSPTSSSNTSQVNIHSTHNQLTNSLQVVHQHRFHVLQLSNGRWWYVNDVRSCEGWCWLDVTWTCIHLGVVFQRSARNSSKTSYVSWILMWNWNDVM